MRHWETTVEPDSQGRGGRRSTTAVRALAACALLGTVLLCGGPASGEIGDADAEFEDEVRRMFGRRNANVFLEDARRHAKSTGELRITGSAHLSGLVFASRLVVEEGAHVTVEPGTMIYVAGDMRVDAPLVMTPAPVASTPKGGHPLDTGQTGETYSQMAVACEGDGSLGDLIGADGGAGEDVVLTPGTRVRGGQGGTGQGFQITCKGSLTLSGAIRPGRGGRGGRGEATGESGSVPGESGETVREATGGDGGAAGKVAISASDVKITGTIRLSRGGGGGVGAAFGGQGFVGFACGRGGDGGSATATGGAAGAGAAIHFLGRTRGVSGLDGAIEDDGHADGGNAEADGGGGASGGACVPAVACPGAGRKGGRGGDGGRAMARGGLGGTAASVRVQGALVVEGAAGTGGRASAFGGLAGPGSSGESAKGPGRGGDGGGSGAATARGGPGGRATQAKGGDGGFAQADGWAGGDGGAGGSCCENPGGAGARGGKAGGGSKLSAKGGVGGDGRPDGGKGGQSDGKTLPAGAAGAAGGACDPFPGVKFTASVDPNPARKKQNVIVTFEATNTDGAAHAGLTLGAYVKGFKLGENVGVTVPATGKTTLQYLAVPPTSGLHTVVLKAFGKIVASITFFAE